MVNKPALPQLKFMDQKAQLTDDVIAQAQKLTSKLNWLQRANRKNLGQNYSR